MKSGMRPDGSGVTFTKGGTGITGDRVLKRGANAFGMNGGHVVIDRTKNISGPSPSGKPGPMGGFADTKKGGC